MCEQKKRWCNTAAVQNNRLNNTHAATISSFLKSKQYEVEKRNEGVSFVRMIHE